MKFLTKLCGIFSLFISNNTTAFDYDLNLYTLQGLNSRTMICFHGYGGNYKIIDEIKKSGIESSLISFNFPDYDLFQREYKPEKTSFGSIKELLPAIYVLKRIVVEQNKSSIDVYGFSAGAGAIINVLSILNTNQNDQDLQSIGVNSVEKAQILKAIQNGLVILDAPLKSIEEIIAYRGSDPELEILAHRYRANHLSPIESIDNLKGLSLNLIVFFQNPDDVLSNRDDLRFVDKLKSVNSGNTTVLSSNDGGHNILHTTLWNYVKHYQ